MRTRIIPAGGAWILTAGLLAGCQSAPRRMPYDDNPLLQSRQPLVQSAPTSDRLAQIAQAGPQTVVPPPAIAGYQQPAPPGFALAKTTYDTTPAQAPSTTLYTPPAPDAGPALPPQLSTAAPPLTPLPSQSAPAAPLMTAPAPAPALTPPAAPPVMAPPPAPAAPVSAAVTTQPAAPAPATEVAVRKVEGRYGRAGDYTWLQGELDRHYRGHLELRYRPASEEDTYGGKVRLEDDPRLAQFRAGDIIAVEGELVRDPEGGSPSYSQNPRYHIRDIRLIERK